MTQWRSQWTISPLGWDWRVTQLEAPPPLSFCQWRYGFEDGSWVEGTGQLYHQNNQDFELKNCQAQYYSNQGQVLIQWRPEDFATWSGGGEWVIVASNDNGVSNSLALVSCPSRSRAQVSQWGVHFVAEAFCPDRWRAQIRSQSLTLERGRWSAGFAPVFPFWRWRWAESGISYQIPVIGARLPK